MISKILSFFFFFLFLSCAKKDTAEIAAYDALARASGNELLGLWKFRNYTDNKKHSYEVSLEFKNERGDDGKLLLSGRSSVNFYTASFEINAPNRTLKIGAIGRTKIAGTPEANEFEQIYLDRLGKATLYDFMDSKTIRIYVSEPAKEVLFFEKN